MATKIQFKEREMREAIAEIRKSATELGTMAEDFSNTANWSAQEALKGDAGEALKTAMQNTLVDRTNKLSEALKKQAAFAEKELEQMIKAAAQLR